MRRSGFDRNEWLAIGALCFFKLAIQLYFSSASGLHRDEFLYLAFGDHLDPGYFSVPPFIGIISWIIGLPGWDDPAWIRLIPALSGVATLLLIAMIVKEAGGKAFAITVAGLAFLLSPVYLRINSLLQPVAFDILAWTAAGYFMLRLVKSGDPRYWIPLFACFALGFLNKYIIAFLMVSFFMALLVTPQRKLFLSSFFLAGGMLALILISPNLYWQYRHQFPVLHHMQELTATQLVNVSRIEFLVVQLLMNMHALILWLTGLIFLLFSRKMANLRVLGLAFMFLLLIMLLLRGKAYYTLGIYPLLFAIGAACVGQAVRMPKKAVRVITVAAIVLLSIPMIPMISMPFLPYRAIEKMGLLTPGNPAYRWEDGEIHKVPQDFADMTGWEELATITEKAYLSLEPAQRESCIIYGENYGQAGAVRHFCKDLPEPFSLNDNFLFWAPDSLSGNYFIYINDEIEDLIPHFEKIELVGKVEDTYFRENGLPVFLCINPDREFREFYKNKVRSLKERF